MKDSLKNSANEIYESARLRSGQTLREEKRKFVDTIASRRLASSMPLSGPELQAVARIYAKHVERCIQARFDSYQEAYKSVGVVPTEAELRVILDGVKAAEEQETRHAGTSLQEFALSHGMSTGRGTSIDPTAVLTSRFSGVHDRVVQDWKVWRANIHLQAEARPKRQLDSKRGWRNILWSWPVIAPTGLLLLGLAGNSIYAGDVIVTFVLSFVGLSLLTVKFIASDQTKNLRFRKSGAITFAVFLILLALGLAKKRTPPPPVPPLITMQISPSTLPISVPSHSVTSVLQLHPYIRLTGDQDGLLKIANEMGKEGCWPTTEELATTEPGRREAVYRIEISNHSEHTLENGLVKFGVQYNAGMQDGGCTPSAATQHDQEDVVLLPPLETGKSFEFYAINQNSSCAWLLPPQSAAVKMAGQEKATEVALAFDKNPLFAAGAPVFSPTTIKWQGVPTHPGGYGVIRTGAYSCKSLPRAVPVTSNVPSLPCLHPVRYTTKPIKSKILTHPYATLLTIPNPNGFKAHTALQVFFWEGVNGEAPAEEMRGFIAGGGGFGGNVKITTILTQADIPRGHPITYEFYSNTFPIRVRCVDLATTGEE